MFMARGLIVLVPKPKETFSTDLGAAGAL